MTFSDFLRDTFRDANNRPSAQLVTAFGVSAGIIAVIPAGLLFGRWVPQEVLWPMLTFAAALLGLDTFITKSKIQAENPQPQNPIVGQADNVNVTQTGEPTQ